MPKLEFVLVLAAEFIHVSDWVRCASGNVFFFKNNIKVMMDFFWTPCALCEDRDCDFLIAPLDPDEGP